MALLQALREALDPTIFWEYRSILLNGLLCNLAIFLLSALGATILGLIVGLARLSRSRTVRVFASSYAEFLRNAPEYILLVCVYYVLPVILTKAWGTRVAFDPVAAAIATLAVTY